MFSKMKGKPAVGAREFPDLARKIVPWNSAVSFARPTKVVASFITISKAVVRYIGRVLVHARLELAALGGKSY